MRAFIVRPFGSKSGIDFDRVDAELIAPALDQLGITGRTTGEIAEQGNIRVDMFQRLATADLVVADISIHNANVFYELGLRHALRERMTFLLRASGDAVPFDLKTDRYTSYDPDDPAAALETLVRGLGATIDSGKTDSPVFQLLPDLAGQDPERLVVVPPDFAEEVERATAERRRGDLSLLSDEVSGLGFEWERAGLRLVGRAQFDLEDWQAARRTWERLRDELPGDTEANQKLGTIYHRLGDLTESDLAVRRALDDPALSRSDRAEAEALFGRNAKARWLTDWIDLPEVERRRAALASPWLRQAIDHYTRGFTTDLNEYYPGINALGLVTVLFDLATALPDEWAAHFDSDRRAEMELDELRDERSRLAGAVALSIAAAESRDGADPWLALTAAEYALLTSEASRSSFVAGRYRRAFKGASDFGCSSAGDQLRFYQGLGVRADGVTAALACLEEELGNRPVATPPQQTAPKGMLLFTGHRLDSADRETPRFPPGAEETARGMIRQVVEAELARARGEAGETAEAPLRALCGGASGGDILFLEVCRELAIPADLYLALPRDPYVKASVADAAGDGDWVARFDALHQTLPTRVLSETKELPRWLRGGARAGGYGIWQRNNLWMLANALGSAPDASHLTLIALWNGEEGDGPGGTKHMLEIARQRGARTVVLDAKELVNGSGS